MDLALFKQSKGKGKSVGKSMKPVKETYSLQHDIVKATVDKKKVKETEVFNKPKVPHHPPRTKKKKKKS